MKVEPPGSEGHTLMAGKVLTGIDIGSDSVKFVTARRGKGGKLQIMNAGMASLGDASSLPDGDARGEAIAAILKGLMTDRRVGIRKAYTCVSGKRVITRYAHVPPMPPHRLAKVMAFEIDNEAPGGDEEVASDFKLLDLPNKDAEFTILIGMAKEDVIRGQRKIFDSVGIKVEDITLGCLPTFHSFVYSRKAELDSMQGPCLVVNIGAEKMAMVILYGTKLFFARDLTPGSNVFTEAIRQELQIPFDNAERIKRRRGAIGGAKRPPDDGIPVIPAGEDVPVIPIAGGPAASPDDEETALGAPQDEEMIARIAARPPAGPQSQSDDPIRRALETSAHSLVNSIQSFLRYAKAQTRLENLEVTRIYITGGGAKLPGLDSHIQMRLGIETQVFDPLENVDYAGLDSAGKEMLEADALCYATALGLVAGRALDESMDMSLLPRPEKERQEFMRHGLYGWAAAAVFGLTVAAMIAGSALLTAKLRRSTQRQAIKISQARKREKELLALKARNADLAQKVDRLKEISLESRTYLAALAVLKGRAAGGYKFPREVVLTSVRTYAGTSPPAPRTIEPKRNRFGKTRLLEKQPKVLMVEGTVSDRVSPDESREIVRRLIDYLANVEGPLGKKVFQQPGDPEESTRDYFKIKLVLNEE